MTILDDKIVRARGADAFLEIHGYCENQDCAAREVVINCKDHDQTLLRDLETHGLRCPVCTDALNVHGAFTAADGRAEADTEARRLVNIQMYQRDHGLLIPTHVLLDDRLPPTPLGWFTKRD